MTVRLTILAIRFVLVADDAVIHDVFFNLPCCSAARPHAAGVCPGASQLQAGQCVALLTQVWLGETGHGTRVSMSIEKLGQRREVKQIVGGCHLV